LENVIGRATVTTTGPNLQLPEGWKVEGSVIDRNTGPSSSEKATSISEAITVEREATLAELERAHILEVLQQTNWRIEGPKGAAVILGMHPNTLRSRMSKLSLQRPSHNDAQQRSRKTISTH
jgi:formate hydrogenlyase transcriptional activator